MRELRRNQASMSTPAHGHPSDLEVQLLTSELSWETRSPARLFPFSLRQGVSLGSSGGLVTQEWAGVLSMEDMAGAGAAVVCA